MKLNDKIKGALFGYALGNALGVGTEFMSKIEAKSYYPDGLRSFSDIIRDAHRSQWEPGEWTNDTEIVTRMLECILEEDGFHIRKLTKEFKRWYDETDNDMSPVYRALCKDPEWTEHPIAAAHRVWQNTGLFEASNEAIQRSIVTGITSHPDNLMEDTRRLVLMTNDDSRCVTTTLVLAKVANSLLHHDRIPAYEELEAICYKVDPRTLPWLEKAYRRDIEELDLDDEDSMSWTRKAMASALWPLWHCNNAPDTFYTIIDEGGDADTNAALAGFIAGLMYGYEALPKEKCNLVRFEYLEDLSVRVADYVRRKFDIASEK